MIKPGLLIVLSGPSGVGKDTILDKLLAGRDDCVLSLSATTRAPRGGETEGVEYSFVSRERFEQIAAAGEMLECAEYSGNLYGTPAGPVVEQRTAGKHVILEIEVQGALQIRERCPDAVFIFIIAPSMDVLRQRLEARGTETPEAIQRRMDVAKDEISKAHLYDYIVINQDLDECVTRLSAVITAADCHIDRMNDFIKGVCDNA